MQKLIFINGSGNEIDLTSGSFGITNWAGLSNVPLNIQTQQVPFEDGGVYLDALMNQRDISVTVAIYDGNNLELRYQKKRELISALNPKLGEGTLIYTNNYLSKQIKAVPQIPLFQNKNSNDAGTLKATVSFSCPSPYWEDVEETVIEINNNDIVEIENNGDVDVQLESSINVDNEKIVLKNLTTQKNIEVVEKQTGIVDINTNLGEKEITLIQDEYKNLYGAGYIGGVEKDGDIILCGTGIYRFNIITEEVSTIENNLNIMSEDITYSPELDLFALAGDNKIFTSKDLVNWTEQSTGGVNVQDIISWEDGVFKAKLSNSTYLKSSDGVNWTSETGTITKNKTKVQLNDFYFKLYQGSTSLIQKSSDNATWETIYTFGYSMTPYFLIVAYNKIYCFAQFGTILKSNDELNDFEVLQGGVIIAYLKKSCSAFNKLYIISNTSGDVLCLNDETVSSIQLDVSRIYGIILYKEKLYIMGYKQDTTKIFESSNGIDFSEYTINFPPSEFQGLFFIDTQNDILYANLSSGLAYKNQNENVWNITDDYYQWVRDNVTHPYVIFYKNYFYIAGPDRNSGLLSIWRTADFNNYTKMYTDTVGNEIQAGLTEDNKIVLAGTSGIILKSGDGANWEKVVYNDEEIISINKIEDIHYFFPRYSSSDPDMIGYTSTDLINFTLLTKNQNMAQNYTYIDVYKNKKYYMGIFNNISTPFFGGDLQKKETNIINKITANSDMNLSIKTGVNNFSVLGSSKTRAILKFRQKYIGV